MTEQAPNLKAPFPAFGGKRLAAELVWLRLGDVPNYIEPFAFSAAMLLCRPHAGRIETINDVDCYVANFWRATQHDPEAVAYYADGPVNEADLHARHRWLVLSRESEEFRQRMRRDPDFYDARVAGWWCWGLCCWIGSGWCSAESEVVRKGAGDQELVKTTWDQRPDIAGFNGDGFGAKGVHAAPHVKRPRIGARKEGHTGTGVNVVNQANTPSEKRPLQTGAGRGPGVHQLPNLSGDSGAAGRGVHASGGPKRPLLSGRSPRDNGHGVHRVNNENTPPDINLHDNKKPLLNAGGNAVETPGRGIHGVNDNNRPQLADAYSRGRGVNGNDAAGTCEQRLAWLLDWFDRLRDRLRTVRVCCGHWKRICDSPSVTTRLGITGVFLDPPYPSHSPDGSASRDSNLYASDKDGRDVLDELRDEVLAWCHERGPDKQMRIAVCGYDTDGYSELEQHGWTVVPWKSQGGYGNRSAVGKANSARERIWFSPHCLDADYTRFPLFRDQ